MKRIYLCQHDELAELQSRGFSLDLDADSRLELFLLKHQGQVSAYLNHCPHLGIPLNWQPDQFMSREGEHVQCATHGALFRPEDGLCIAGPCRGESLTALNIEQDDSGGIYLVSAAS